MHRIRGLKEYIATEKFKEALNIALESELELKMLAQGEYNINYIFTHPTTNKKLLLRVNTGSQMHLDNQIEYEYNALKAIYKSGRTPNVYYVDGSLKDLDYGVLIMEFLDGVPLDYKKDLLIAASCLADIHSIEAQGINGLISPRNPLEAMIEECHSMARVYLESKLGDEKIKSQIKRLLSYGKELIKSEKEYEGKRSIINTELNSGNFLINGEGKDNYIIDWEKPIFGEVAQDLAHFLAPTTTFWKTDVILEKSEMEEFIDEYIKVVNGRFNTEDLRDRFKIYLPLTCLRGVTWCSMAWIEYQDPNRLIKNEFTYNKIKAYLEAEFLNRIENEYFH
ncbi:aminoglycoside phosphotransferase family protein [Clostridium cylindrosporum]|uniref:Phosphotransferase enzyme family n=1 Tax=Clostridium cylindrosporum DSM 605 TaxID=1121307 RepID=A0A0J8DE40_CLOCY|nr:aminoglycoside phosphotransferase family protein [Clostridium cylindrosporum]KMT22478.1 phosphotransferase enzyme family [Clostridium cylindrosporum DSM 605]